MPACLARRRRGFSFAEVMFAVIILGVGFIMIAALFPVAIKQSKSNADETNAAAQARGGNNVLATIADNSSMVGDINNTLAITFPLFNSVPALTAIYGQASPPTGTFAVWQKLKGNLISADDPRYAWVPIYIRQTDPLMPSKLQAMAQVVMICVQSTIKPVFDATDVQFPNPASGLNVIGNLQPRPVSVMIANGNDTVGDPDLIGFAKSIDPAYTNVVDGTGAVAEGAFVVIRSTDFNNPGNNDLRFVGRVYRIGARRTDLDGQPYGTVNFAGMKVWELAPGYDFAPEPVDQVYNRAAVANLLTPAGSSVEAWVVGRALSNNNYNPSFSPSVQPTFDGPAMDVSAYTTTVYCKP